MDHKAFWTRVREYESKGLRLGQAIYNVAFELCPGICQEVVDMVGDPYYQDELATLFFVEFSQIYELRECYGLLDEPIANFKKGIVSDPIDLEQRR